ncbi:MAG: class II fructose-bisphosphate aldolase, partial [Firmicutes bacterium]|nr:class II fructose-bisphosphate aldolase [Bacillota bacterium]
FSSVMFDGSQLPFEENIKGTQEAVKLAREVGASVEGELGAIAGAEDDLQIAQSSLTDPQQALEFVQKTGVDALAVAIGNRHGLYQKKPDLDLKRLQAIQQVLDIPIVLHGGSLIPDSQVRRSIKLGVRKFNVATELKIAFTNALRQTIKETTSFEPSKTLGPAREAVQKLAQKKMRLLGCSGQGSLWKNQMKKKKEISR